MMDNITDEQLITLLKERGLQSQIASDSLTNIEENSLEKKLDSLQKEIIEKAKLCRSINLMPQSIKTPLMDIIIGHLLSEQE